MNNKIEGVPEGWELVRIDEAKPGEWFINGQGVPMESQSFTIGGTAIVRKIESPKPTYIPWTFETCPVGAVVRHKTQSYKGVITAVSVAKAWLGNVSYDYMVLLEDFERDGTPCGTVEVQE